MSSPLSVCVFCASSEAVSATLRAVARELGCAIAGKGWRLVYGGGGVGLMGEVARSALAGGGHVTGVIPHRLATHELALDEVTELIRTDTMRERKHLMDQGSDAFVIMPGGIGTLEELVEIITLKQLGYHDRAVVLLDPEDYWRPLLAQFDRMVELGLAQPGLRRLWVHARDVPAAIEALATAPVQPPPPEARDRERLESVEAPRS